MQAEMDPGPDAMAPEPGEAAGNPEGLWGDGHPVVVDALQVARRLVALEEVQRQPVVRDLERAVVAGDGRERARDAIAARRGGARVDRQGRPGVQAAAR